MDSDTLTVPSSVRIGLTQVIPEAENAIWQPLSGGRTNQIWQVTGQGERPAKKAGSATCWVVKLFVPGSGNALFPNDPACEVRALQSLSSQAWAPTLLARFDTPIGACVVYAHIEGSCWDEDARAVGTLMRQLHRSAIPPGLRVVHSSPSALATQSRDFLLQADAAPSQLPEAPEETSGDPVPQVFLHGDIVAGNLIGSATGLSLIDWQCPGVGDPCHDIAIFLSPAMMQLYRGRVLSPQEETAFFVGYDDPQVAARYRSLKPWFHHRMAAYCLWRFTQGAEDYGVAMQLEFDALSRGLKSQ